MDLLASCKLPLDFFLCTAVRKEISCNCDQYYIIRSFVFYQSDNDNFLKVFLGALFNLVLNRYRQPSLFQADWPFLLVKEAPIASPSRLRTINKLIFWSVE